MRVLLTTTLVLLATASIAWSAPVHADPKIERAKLELLWKDLHDYSKITPAVFALIEHPQAAAFLDEKIRPLNVSKEQIQSWMKDLNSDDEKVRDRAFDELDYYDPRLQLSIQETLDLATTDQGRRKLLDLLFHPRLSPWDSFSDLTLKITDGDKDSTEIELNWILQVRNTAKPCSQRNRFATLRKRDSNAWIANALAAVVLERIGTPAAFRTLEKLAIGNPEALPTRMARAFLQPGPPAPLTGKNFDARWDDLATWRDVGPVRSILAFSDDPNAAKLLKAKLPAIKAEKVTIEKWLADLSSDKDEVWRPAFESLQYFRPQLVMPLNEMVTQVKDDRSRSALYALLTTTSPAPKAFEIRKQSMMKIEVQRLDFIYSGPGGRTEVEYYWEGNPDYSNPAEWNRARNAIIALERNASTEAVAVLKQLADGHPAILPTKEAKAALKKLGR